MSKLNYLYPFLESEELSELAIKIVNGEVEGVKLAGLLPFLDHEDINKLVDMLIEKNDGKTLRYTIPFISSEKVLEIYEAVKAEKLTGIRETSLYPFLGKSQLKELFGQLVKEAAENPVEDDDSDEEDIEAEFEEE